MTTLADIHEHDESPLAQATESAIAADRKETLREQVHEKTHGQTTVHGHEMDRSDIVKFTGLIAFFALLAIIIYFAWPWIADAFEEGGVERMVERLQNAGPAGVFILLGMQFLQIIVAFIPGEIVQLAAGLMYGPIAGSFIILLGCLFSAAIIYKLVHVLGAPFVQGMVSTEHLEKFRRFEESGKLDTVVFILFLIPAMPKDVFTYLVPLTDMDMKRFLTLTTIGRIPGVVASTYIASAWAAGNTVGSVVVGVVALSIALCAFVFRDKILTMEFLHRKQAGGESDGR